MYKTISDYKRMIEAMNAREVEGLAETFNRSTTLTRKDMIIRDLLNADMERRIVEWEVQ